MQIWCEVLSERFKAFYFHVGVNKLSNIKLSGKNVKTNSVVLLKSFTSTLVTAWSYFTGNLFIFYEMEATKLKRYKPKADFYQCFYQWFTFFSWEPSSDSGNVVEAGHKPLYSSVTTLIATYSMGSDTYWHTLTSK